MLVLSRQRDESILIGDNIKITIVDIRDDKVRLGIDAPKEIPVHRQEVFDDIQRSTQMLVLSRQRDESIIIANNIKITIVDIRDDKVRLGLDVPNHISVHRQEVFDAIQRENDEQSERP
jgi:carbon storage regulator